MLAAAVDGARLLQLTSMTRVRPVAAAQDQTTRAARTRETLLCHLLINQQQQSLSQCSVSSSSSCSAAVNDRADGFYPQQHSGVLGW